MPLTVRLDQETERCLRELQAETGQDRSSLIRQLIRERWQRRIPAATISQQLGGHPASFLDTAVPGSAERQVRRQSLNQRLKEHSRKRHG